MSATDETSEEIRRRIQALEIELEIARGLLSATSTEENATATSGHVCANNIAAGFSPCRLPSHPLLLLSDTALPLGSFAFSSGLESYLAHQLPRHATSPSTLPTFMHMSLTSLASSTLPYLLAVLQEPERALALDDELDACLLCPVARRASVSQGKGLVTVWERAFRGGGWEGGGEKYAHMEKARRAIETLCERLRKQGKGKVSRVGLGSKSWWDEHEVGVRIGKDEDVKMQQVHAHFPIIYALVCAACGLNGHETAFTYLFNHAKAVASAAVRAGVLGPYAAQGWLGSAWLKAEIEAAMEREWETEVEMCGQTVPALDVWMGRHELLYSRIFNS